MHFSLKEDLNVADCTTVCEGQPGETHRFSVGCRKHTRRKNWREGISQAESMMAPASTRLETSLSSNDIVMLVSPSKKVMTEASV